ncbi:MAG: hypothetical protein ACQERU_05935, partial [Bacteroidota bacterium]
TKYFISNESNYKFIIFIRLALQQIFNTIVLRKENEPSHDYKFDTVLLSVSKYTRMIIMKLIVCFNGYLMHHGELHPDCIGTSLTAKIKIINR